MLKQMVKSIGKKIISSLCAKLPARARCIVAKIAQYTLRELENPPFAPPRKNDRRLRMAYICCGGMGDLLIYINYLTYIRALAGKDTVIDVISELDVITQPVLDIALANAADNAYGSRWYRENYRELDYDNVITLCRLPYFERYDSNKTATLAPKLLPHFNAVIAIGRRYGRDWVLRSDAQVISWTRINGRKRINQFDLDNHLGMSEAYHIKVPIAVDEEKTLARFGLSKRKFITICREASMASGPENTRLWCQDQCEQLVHLLKAEYGPKDYVLVQVGTTKLGTGQISSIDMSLLDKTDLESLKVLLKWSALHVDTDTGMMHLRSALRGGKSVIVFGPTSKEMLGYSENINVSAGICSPPCEWITPDWYTKCVRGDHACMKMVTAKMVMEQIRKEAIL